MRNFLFYPNRKNSDDAEIIGEDYVLYKAGKLKDLEDFVEGEFSFEEVNALLDDVLREGHAVFIDEAFTKAELEAMSYDVLYYRKDADTVDSVNMRAFAFYHDRTNLDNADIVGEDFVLFKGNYLEDPEDFKEGEFSFEEVNAILDDILEQGFAVYIEETFSKTEWEALPEDAIFYRKDSDTVHLDIPVSKELLPFLD